MESLARKDEQKGPYFALVVQVTLSEMPPKLIAVPVVCR